MWRCSVSVWPPAAYEPPTMPICATPLPYDTSRNTGELSGNVPSVATRETTPLTEIETVGAGAAVVVVGVVPVAAGDCGMTLVDGVTVGVVDVGVVLVGTSAPGLFAFVGVEELGVEVEADEDEDEDEDSADEDEVLAVTDTDGAEDEDAKA